MEASKILIFAKISEITYEDPKTSKAKFKEYGYEIVKFFNKKGAQGYLLKGDDYILSFRGTEVKQISDIIADLKLHKVDEINNEINHGKVHVGFKDELDKLWPSILKEIKNIDKLYVTGHSLGAAMATIAASRIQDKVISLVTFGSPRVGSSYFRKTLNVEHYRVQNNCDDVTKVPPYLFGFRHHGTHIYLNFYGNIRKLTTWQLIKDMIRSRIRARKKGEKFIGLYDHFMANYIKKINLEIDSEKGK